MSSLERDRDGEQGKVRKHTSQGRWPGSDPSCFILLSGFAQCALKTTRSRTQTTVSHVGLSTLTTSGPQIGILSHQLNYGQNTPTLGVTQRK